MTTNALMELAESIATDMDNFAEEMYQGGSSIYDFAERVRALGKAAEAATQLRTAAAEGDRGEVVAHQWLRNGEPTGGWFDGVPSERQLQAQKQCAGVAEWTVKYAYSRPTHSGAGRDGERLDFMQAHPGQFSSGTNRFHQAEGVAWFHAQGFGYFPTIRQAIDTAIAGAAGEE